jgi:hypothetical protein
MLTGAAGKGLDNYYVSNLPHHEERRRMTRRRSAALSAIALLSLGFTTTAAASQTKPSTTSPAKRSSPVAARTIPTIKCTDPDTMAACKSFKQLVEARDERILKIVMGRQSKYYGHIAYICLRGETDEFKTVDFDLPNKESYRPYSSYLSDDVLRRSEELSAFFGQSTPYHPVDPAIQDQWFNEYLNQEVYDFGDVDLHQYENGLHEYWEIDHGKWSRTSESQSNPAYDAEATFEGAYVWLERHTGNDKDSPDIGDDPEHAHISIVDGKIHIHYSFESKTGVDIHVQLDIQESTGRFTQTVFVPALSSLGPIEESGTCMIFK